MYGNNMSEVLQIFINIETINFLFTPVKEDENKITFVKLEGKLFIKSYLFIEKVTNSEQEWPSEEQFLFHETVNIKKNAWIVFVHGNVNWPSIN